MRQEPPQPTLREYIQDLILASAKGRTKRAEGARGVDNHITVAMQPRLGEEASRVPGHLKTLLDQLEIPSNEQEKLNAAFLIFRQEEDAHPGTAAPPINVLSEEVSEALEAHLNDGKIDFLPFINQYIPLYQPLIEELYRHASNQTLDPVTIEKALLSNDALSSFMENRVYFFLGAHPGLIGQYIRPALNQYFGIKESVIEQLSLVFYHIYVFQQTQMNTSKPTDLEAVKEGFKKDIRKDFKNHISAYAKGNPGCANTVTLSTCKPFLEAIDAGHYDALYEEIALTYNNQPHCESQDHHLHHWTAEIDTLISPDSKKVSLSREELVTIQEKLMFGHTKNTSVLSEIITFVKNNNTQAIQRSDHCIPIALPYLILTFFGQSEEDPRLSEENLAHLLRDYLINSDGQLNRERFETLMLYSKRPYERTDLLDSEQGQQLDRLNDDLVFFLLGKDPKIADKIGSKELGQMEDVDRLNRPMRAYVAERVRYLLGEPLQNALSDDASFQEWKDYLTTLLRESPINDQIGAIEEPSYAIPATLHYLTEAFFSESNQPWGLTEDNLSALLRVYLLDRQGQFNGPHFETLMLEARHSYQEVDGLKRVNFNLIFSLLAQDRAIANKIEEKQLQEMEGVDGLGQPMRVYIAERTRYLLGEPLEHALSDDASFQEWEDNLTTLLREAPINDQIGHTEEPSYAIPATLHYLTEAFFIDSNQPWALTEDNLSTLLRVYLLGRQGQFNSPHFKTLMLEAKHSYEGVDALEQVNFNRVFSLLAQDPIISNGIGDKQLQQIRDVDQLSRPMRVYAEKKLSSLLGVPSDDVGNKLSFQEWVKNQYINTKKVSKKDGAPDAYYHLRVKQEEQIATLLTTFASPVTEKDLVTEIGNALKSHHESIASEVINDLFATKNSNQVLLDLRHLADISKANKAFGAAIKRMVAKRSNPMHEKEGEAAGIGALAGAGGGAVGTGVACAVGVLTTNPLGWFALIAGAAVAGVAAPVALLGWGIKRLIDGPEIRLYWKIDTAADGTAPKGAPKAPRASITGSVFAEPRNADAIEEYQPFLRQRNAGQRNLEMTAQRTP